MWTDHICYFVYLFASKKNIHKYNTWIFLGYQCVCDPGYYKSGSTCVDIDECVFDGESSKSN